MGFLTRADDRFVEKAVDDNRRASAIADMNWRRVMFLCLLVIVGVIVLLDWFTHAEVWANGAFLAAICASAAFKQETELRLLKVIDRLRKEGRDGALVGRREVKGDL